MTESFNILERLDGIDRIIEAIQSGKKVALTATVETNPWVPASVKPKVDNLVVGTKGGNFFVTWFKEDGTWGNYVGDVEMWMYIPGLPQQQVVVPVPDEKESLEKEEIDDVINSERKMSKEEYNIRQALKEENSKTKAAKKLGISVPKLTAKMKEYNIK